MQELQVIHRGVVMMIMEVIMNVSVVRCQSLVGVVVVVFDVMARSAAGPAAVGGGAAQTQQHRKQNRHSRQYGTIQDAQNGRTLRQR